MIQFKLYCVISWLALMIIHLPIHVKADQSFYMNTNGAEDPTIHLNLGVNKIVRMYILVDGDSYAGTTNNIRATFVGDFASSGPTLLGSFPKPSTAYELSIPLEREIGTLQSIWIENTGHDSLLLSQIRCRINSDVYQLDIPRVWLHTYNPAIINANNENGFTPDADISLPSSSTLLLPVSSQYLDYNYFGVFHGK
jgi:hypothetical protein